MTRRQAIVDIVHRYWDLGFISFGGPGVHVIILRKRFVDTVKWLDTKTFLDLFALGNALPGPGSTQLAFSIAVVKHGVWAGLLAFLLWSLPGAIGMAGLAVGISRIPDTLPSIVLALLTGLNAAAVGLIALAAFQLANAAGTDGITIIWLWLSASFGICYHAPWMYPTLIVAGGLSTLVWDFRRQWIIQPLRRTLGRSQRRRQSGAPSAGDRDGDGDGDGEGEQVEMRDIPTTTTGTPAPVSSVTSIAPPESPSEEKDNSGSASNRPPSITTTPAPSDTNGMRQRNPPPDVDVEPASPVTPPESSPLKVVSVRVAIALLIGFVLLLTIPLATRAGLHNAGKDVPRALDFFCNMIIAGTIIFGGGPVVIPLLRDYVVVEGWVSSRDFLLVFAILQAFPGPNFNFAVALGVLALPWSQGLGAVLGYIGIFSPGIILKLALLPLYSSWRDKALARSVIRGLNAAASGLVFTAVWQLFLVGYIYQSATGSGGDSQTLSGPLTADPFWAVVASGSFLATKSFKSPPWLSIIGGGLGGLAWYGVRSS